MDDKWNDWKLIEFSTILLLVTIDITFMGSKLFVSIGLLTSNIAIVWIQKNNLKVKLELYRSLILKGHSVIRLTLAMKKFIQIEIL